MNRLKVVIPLLVVLLVLTACGSSASQSAPTAPAASTDSPTAVTTGETGGETSADGVDRSKLSAQLNVYNWADYIDPEILTDFEQEYGVKVIVDVYDSNEDMIGKVRPGGSGYDVVVPSDYAVDIMVRENLLEPLDKSLLTNFGNLKPELLDLYYDKGNVYSVPYNTGTSGIAYDASQFDTPPDSWAIVFDPEQVATLKGQFSMLDDSREVPGAALRYIGRSLNDTDPEALKQVEQILKQQKASPMLASYDSSNSSRNLASGAIVLANIYNNNALQARMGLEGDDGYPGNENIRYFVPKEGGTIWQDNLAILADSPNKYTAHVFINYLLRPEVAAKNEEYILGITPNAEAEKLLPAELQELFKEGFAPDEETMKRLEWIERNDETVAFDDLWTAVKGE